MDASGRVYQAPEGEIPQEDKDRIDALRDELNDEHARRLREAGITLPTIGRIVHYCEGESRFPALVTAIQPDGTLSLTVFEPGSTCYKYGVGQTRLRSLIAGWQWPERSHG